jgi:dihydropteroate synthase
MQFPKIMGILNVTPDSFSDGGEYVHLDSAFFRAQQMVNEGVDIIDIGGESSRPGAEPVSIEEEINRVVPIIKKVREFYPQVQISIDTVKYEVAKEAVSAGATIINDISGLNHDPRLADLAGETNSSLVLMHMKGTPKTMQKNPEYEDVFQEVYDELEKKINFAKSKGVKEVIADVGIGFGKDDYHNWTLLRRHKEFEKLGVPMLLGISRKSFIWRSFDVNVPTERDRESMMIHALMLNMKTDIIRVHNVVLHNRLRDVFKLLHPEK